MDQSDNIKQIQTEISPEEAQKTFDDLTSQINQLKEQNLRLLADYQNQKKQYDKQFEDLKFFGVKKIMGEIIALLDDNLLAEEHIDKSGDKGEYKNAFQQVTRKLSFVVHSENINEIDCKEGDEFDPEMMEAIGTVPDEKNVNKVKVVVQKGYKHMGLNKIIRPARVLVGK